MKHLLTIFLLCLTLGSCHTYQCGVTDDMFIHDTTFVTRFQHDSIYKQDSIYVHEYLVGDTVHIEREKLRILYRDRLRHDTLYIHRTDTIIKTMTIEKKTSWGGSVKSFFDELLACIAIIAIAVIGYLIILWNHGK